MIGTDTNLGQALARYLEAVKEEIRNQKSIARPADTRIVVLISQDELLRRAVRHAEEGEAFQDLVREAASLYYPEGFARGSLSRLSQQTAEFFRLSGIYCDLFDGQPVQLEEQLAHLEASFEATTQTVTYYAPIEWVYLGKQAIPFGEFEIRQLTEAEIEAIFQDRIRRVFYPWARVNSAELAGYWFLIAKESVPVDPPGRTLIRFNVRVDPHRPRFSTPIDRALSLLALGDWSTRTSTQPSDTSDPAGLDHTRWPLPALVPFVVSVSSSLLDWPRRAPDTSVLNRIEETDPQTGDVYDRPNFQVYWDASRAEDFERLLASVSVALERIQMHERPWAFVHVALRFLGKAFTSEGIESLLWNMTAIDALLGEDRPPLKARLSDRIGRILGEPEKAEFKTLYGIRSDLVHGNAEFRSEAHLGHLGTAREIARSATLWILRYLVSVAEAVQRSNCLVPDRADVLALLDGDDAARQRHPAIAKALQGRSPR